MMRKLTAWNVDVTVVTVVVDDVDAAVAVAVG